VHLAGGPGAELERVLLLDGQGVEVAAIGDDGARMLAVNVSYEPGRHWPVVGNAPLLEHGGHVFGGFEFFEAQLGTFMHVPPPTDQVGFCVLINSLGPVHPREA